MTAHHHHLGVYAVVTSPAGELLVIQKARGPYTGLLDLPGGSMEDGELLEDTLRRELHEETGCALVAASQMGAFSALTPYRKNNENRLLRHVAILYRCTVDGTPTPHADGQDSHGALWAAPGDIEANGSPIAKLAVANL